MRKLLCASAVFAVILVSANLAQSGEDKDARAIVNKAIKAGGGEAKLPKAMTWTEKGTYYGMGDGLPFTGKYAMQWPGQFRMEIKDVFTIVLDGDKGWMQMGDTTREMKKEEVAQQKHDHRAGWIASLVPLKDKEFQLKTAPEAKVDGKATSVVVVSRKDYPTVKLYFSKDTGLLVKSEFKTKAAELEFKEVTQSTHFSDYKDVNGAKVPYKLAVKRDGKIYVEAELSDVDIPGKLDAKVFAKPGE
ncbi:MAG TPA: hypothetical protein VFE62_17075 [Gemmataceae bacterium]|nr:hypothetical protein [Gemmataceae bacterium]